MIASWTRIDEERRKQGLTLKQMAENTGVSESAVQYWKHGKNISIETLERLALVLGTSRDYLLGRAPISAPASASESPSLPSPPQLLREPRAEYTTAPDYERRIRFLEDQCAAIVPQLNEIRTILISLLAEERRQHAPPLATPDRKEKVG